MLTRIANEKESIDSLSEPLQTVKSKERDIRDWLRQKCGENSSESAADWMDQMDELVDTADSVFQDYSFI